jgi:hypothetical protein
VTGFRVRQPHFVTFAALPLVKAVYLLNLADPVRLDFLQYSPAPAQ